MSNLSVQDEAGKIKKEASDLDKLIDKTEKEYNDLRDDLKGKEQEVRKLLEKGKSEQQVSPTLTPQMLSNGIRLVTLLLSPTLCRPLTSCWPAPMQPKLGPRRPPRRASPPSERPRAFWRTCEVRLLNPPRPSVLVAALSHSPTSRLVSTQTLTRG